MSPLLSLVIKQGLAQSLPDATLLLQMPVMRSSSQKSPSHMHGHNLGLASDASLLSLLQVRAALQTERAHVEAKMVRKTSSLSDSRDTL
jgi:hypothetical protein